METNIKSPFTGGIVNLLEREEEVTFRGEKIKISRKYYKCRDTGREFTDSTLDDEMMWTVFRKYCELKSPDGHFPKLIEDNDILRLDGVISDSGGIKKLYRRYPGHADFSERLSIPSDAFPDIPEDGSKRVMILILECPEDEEHEETADER